MSNLASFMTESSSPTKKPLGVRDKDVYITFSVKIELPLWDDDVQV